MVERFYQLPKQLPTGFLFRVCWFFVRIYNPEFQVYSGFSMIHLNKLNRQILNEYYHFVFKKRSFLHESESEKL